MTATIEQPSPAGDALRARYAKLSRDIAINEKVLEDLESDGATPYLYIHAVDAAYSELRREQRSVVHQAAALGIELGERPSRMSSDEDDRNWNPDAEEA